MIFGHYARTIHSWFRCQILLQVSNGFLDWHRIVDEIHWESKERTGKILDSHFYFLLEVPNPWIISWLVNEFGSGIHFQIFAAHSPDNPSEEEIHWEFTDYWFFFFCFCKFKISSLQIYYAIQVFRKRIHKIIIGTSFILRVSLYLILDFYFNFMFLL